MIWPPYQTFTSPLRRLEGAGYSGGRWGRGVDEVAGVACRLARREGHQISPHRNSQTSRCFARFSSRASPSPRAARPAEMPRYRACTSGACGRPGAGASSYWRHGPVRIGGRGSLLSRRNGALPYSTGDFKWVVNCLLVCFTDAKTWSRSADTRTGRGARSRAPSLYPAPEHHSRFRWRIGERS